MLQYSLLILCILFTIVFVLNEYVDRNVWEIFEFLLDLCMYFIQDLFPQYFLFNFNTLHVHYFQCWHFLQPWLQDDAEEQGIAEET